MTFGIQRVPSDLSGKHGGPQRITEEQMRRFRSVTDKLISKFENGRSALYSYAGALRAALAGQAELPPPGGAGKPVTPTGGHLRGGCHDPDTGMDPTPTSAGNRGNPGPQPA